MIHDYTESQSDQIHDRARELKENWLWSILRTVETGTGLERFARQDHAKDIMHAAVDHMPLAHIAVIGRQRESACENSLLAIGGAVVIAVRRGIESMAHNLDERKPKDAEFLMRAADELFPPASSREDEGYETVRERKAS